MSGLACGWCHGDGDACTPANADPTRAPGGWLPPVPCPRCGGTGWDPSEPHPVKGYDRNDAGTGPREDGGDPGDDPENLRELLNQAVEARENANAETLRLEAEVERLQGKTQELHPRRAAR